MFRQFLLAKIHRATITRTELEYEGSIGICPYLLEASGILPWEKVDVYNLSNGERFSTYVIRGQKEEICLNGAAALKGKPGDKIIIAAYAYLSQNELGTIRPQIILVDQFNRIIKK